MSILSMFYISFSVAGPGVLIDIASAVFSLPRTGEVLRPPHIPCLLPAAGCRNFNVLLKTVHILTNEMGGGWEILLENIGKSHDSICCQ